MKIKPIHHRLANLILENELINAQMAEKLNICERVIYKWVKEPEFQAILDERCEQAKRKAIQLASNNAVRAVECLLRFLKPPISDPEATRKAANDVLAWARLSREKGEDGKETQIIQIVNNIPDTVDNVKSNTNSRFELDKV